MILAFLDTIALFFMLARLRHWEYFSMSHREALLRLSPATNGCTSLLRLPSRKYMYVMLAILWYFVLILFESIIWKAKLGCVQTVSNKCNEMQNCYHSFDAFSSEWYAQNMWQKIWLTFSVANYLLFENKIGKFHYTQFF